MEKLEQVEIDIKTLSNKKTKMKVTSETTVREVRENCNKVFSKENNKFGLVTVSLIKEILPDDDLILNHGNVFIFRSIAGLFLLNNHSHKNHNTANSQNQQTYPAFQNNQPPQNIVNSNS